MFLGWVHLYAGSPSPSFVEVSQKAHLDFQHESGKSLDKYMIETFGSGGGFLDYDNDGWQDIYLVNSGSTPAMRSAAGAFNRLFRNNQNGTFTDVTSAAGVGNPSEYGMGCAFGDYNNDGYMDIYVTNFGPNVLYRNNGDGTFSDVTDPSGLADQAWSTSAAFADYDRDGWLDLYVCNYLDYSIEKNQRCLIAGGLSYCHPHVYSGVQDTFYRNLGDGHFENATEKAGLVAADPKNSKSLGVIWTDMDRDGFVDLFVASDSTANHVFRNRGDGSFQDVSLISGGAFNGSGEAEAGMGIDAADFDQSGWMHIIITNFSHETNTLYYNEGGGRFRDRTIEFQLESSSILPLGFGINFLDFDNDGYFDLFVANGHILDNAEEMDRTLSYEQPNRLFRYDRRGKFREVSGLAGAYFARRNVSRGSAVGDFNNDGRVDVLVCNNGGKADLLENRSLTENHWIKLQLEGTHCSRDAIGTRVLVTADGYRLAQEVRSGGSYLSQGDLRLNFGLGKLSKIGSIGIVWPCGKLQEVTGPVRLNQILRIKEALSVKSEVE